MNNEISNEVLKELIRRQPNDTFGLAMAELLAHREAATPALNDVIAERQRQITTEGWTPEHDDQHSDNELAGAAACYAMNMHDFYIHYTDELNWSEAPKPDDWPWSEEWWKPTNPRRDLVKAAALILAEIERLDRAAIAKAAGESENDN